ncbi:MAG TPA: hypothetical protein VHC69_28380 [Polyangiaceae bacterium]|nr:hypothetical protein [Polyangiaceae bacterium]
MNGGAGREATRDERIARGLLGVTVLAFVLFCVEFVPRLTNAHFGDVEFTGWSGPLGSRLLRGERPYVDFVLPIPPGSFVLLALLEKLCGRPLLLQELALNATMHLCMGLLAYAMARTISSPKVAVLTAVATLGTVIQLNKECAYDHTAQVVAWVSVAAGMSALASRDAARRARRWIVTGALAGFTLAFKQSTAIGSVLGWFLAFAYLAFADARAGHPGHGRQRLAELVLYLRGVAFGLAAVWLLLLLLGSTARAFFQATFVDGSILKGGPKFLLRNLTSYLFDFPSYAAPLAAIAAFVYLGYRVVVRSGGLSIDDEGDREAPFRRWEVATVAALVVATFGGGFLVLALGLKPYPVRFIAQIDRLKMLPPMTLVTLAALFVADLVPSGAPRSAGYFPDWDAASRRLNAGALAAFAASLMHNTSAPEFRPFYDNNAVIPLAFLSLFIVLERADLRVVSAALLALFLFSAAGNKFFRAMTANDPIGTNGHWAWLRLNEHDFTIAVAAARARQLAGPKGTVLVLPEDVQLEALVDRPRPPLVGAIVFVDQYAPRLARDDIARLDDHPPEVVIVHPRRPSAWQRFFRIWSGRSGAERVVRHVLFDMLPRMYRRDFTVKTTFAYEPAKLDVYVRRAVPLTPEEAAREEDEDDEGRDMLPDDAPADDDAATAPAAQGKKP